MFTQPGPSSEGSLQSSSHVGPKHLLLSDILISEWCDVETWTHLLVSVTLHSFLTQVKDNAERKSEIMGSDHIDALEERSLSQHQHKQELVNLEPQTSLPTAIRKTHINWNVLVLSNLTVSTNDLVILVRERLSQWARGLRLCLCSSTQVTPTLRCRDSWPVVWAQGSSPHLHLSSQLPSKVRRTHSWQEVCTWARLKTVSNEPNVWKNNRKENQKE